MGSKDAPRDELDELVDAWQRELVRIGWALHCQRNRREELVRHLDQLDRKRAKLRREKVDAEIALAELDERRVEDFERGDELVAIADVLAGGEP